MISFLPRFLPILFIFASNFCHAQDDLVSWERAYRELLQSDEHRALAMLQDRYDTTRPSVEKLYLSSKIHGYMILRGQPYHGNRIAYDDEYSQLEQTFISALNHEERLQFDLAKKGYLTLLKHYTETNHLQGKVLFEYHLCRSLNRQGQFYSASLYCSSLRTHMNDNENILLPSYKALRVIANNFEYVGDYKNALKSYQEYLAIIPDYIDPSGVYNDAALLLKTLGNLSLAKEYAKIALKLRNDNKSELHLAQTHHSMGDILLADAQYDNAIHHFMQSRDILEKYNNDYGLTYALLGLGKAHIARQEFATGTAYLLDALEKATLQANGQIRGNVYLTLANAHQVQGQYQRAEDFANQALSLSAEISSEPLRSDALKALADLAREQSHYQKALDYYQEYINTELNKRDELHQSAYVALDVARKDYIQQLQHSKIAQQNLQQKQHIDHQQTWIQFLTLSCSLLAIFLAYSTYSKHKATRRAELDLLTHAWNRAAAIREIKQLPQLAQDGFNYLIVLLDLDDFKKINDAYGHPTGDRALMKIADAIRSQCKKGDIFGRLGGEEFVIVMRKVDELETEEKVKRLHRAIAEATFFSESKEKLNVTASFSYLTTTKALADFDELYSILDQALYQVKQTGKNKIIDAFNEPIYLPNSVYEPAQTSQFPG
ncbi:putative GGDEF family protein [Vibrio sinaloensis DSM 21326]|uniref:diguanylate cyclase n=1 Tax=Vibrio sinaloensis DSM 21326 TaxID=945550 RepID=E8M5V4_PHOS4|nr:tetratricopeptide repeat-containing diguanylate cyclase [Vibrio sinaloensis]EGA70404.1 putative GGDEF family protein [Vibrio sinaloensis DSM 21326]